MSNQELRTTLVTSLKGIGDSLRQPLAKLGLYYIPQLLFLFPRDWEDHTDIREVPDLDPEKMQTVVGEIAGASSRNTRNGTITTVDLRCASGGMRAVFFNQPYITNALPYGAAVMFTGKPKQDRHGWQMTHPKFTLLGEEASPERELRYDPVYPLTDGIKQWQLQRIVAQAVEKYADQVEEVFPAECLEAYGLLPIAEAIRKIHAPKTRDELDAARYRFVYQEFFILQLAMAVRRKKLQMIEKATPLEATAKINARILRLFPFDLTGEQRKVMQEIAADLEKPHPMNRLLQGDVGTGKTVVAIYAMLVAVAHQTQAAMMAPTEILAVQHYKTLKKFLAESHVNVAMLSGSASSKERKALLEELATGKIQILVGTHALISDDVKFDNLSLVVIDEQHKFGVRQRAKLRAAGGSPHTLVMTATPIPRTISMSLFADVDVSSLRETPPGRKKVSTYVVDQEGREDWWKFYAEKIRSGSQGFVVTPLIDDTAGVEFESLEAAYRDLSEGALSEFRLGYVHGRMSSEEKNTAMQDFATGETQVLLATSLVEVGVDVPGANVMAILGADRFGLAQLHQIRGRIVRSSKAGFCGVISDAESETAQKRLKEFAKTTDGFALAELDFQTRGPGELLGTSQSGFPPFHIADLLNDQEILEASRKNAVALVSNDPGLSEPRHERLREMTLARFGEVLDLTDLA